MCLTNYDFCTIDYKGACCSNNKLGVILMNYGNNTEWSKVAEPFNELNKINQKAAEEAVRESISFYNDCASTALSYAQTLPRVTGPEDFFKMQAKAVSQQLEKVLSYTESLAKIGADVFREQSKWAEDKFNSAVKTTSSVMKPVDIHSKHKEA
jgi:hypothetical protein